MTQRRPSKGKLLSQIISSQPADSNSEQALIYDRNFPIFPNEALYIYSFLENKLIFAKGFESILGIADHEVSLLDIISSTSPEHLQFSMELSEKAFQFISEKKERLEDYGFEIELRKMHRNGKAVPLISRVQVFKSQDGKVSEIIGRIQINYSIKFGKVMRFSTFGPDKEELEDIISKVLVDTPSMSDKEREVLYLVVEGKSYKEIAPLLNISQSTVEKRIMSMFKKFEVKSLPQLINFAHENYLLSPAN